MMGARGVTRVTRAKHQGKTKKSKDEDFKKGHMRVLYIKVMKRFIDIPRKKQAQYISVCKICRIRVGEGKNRKRHIIEKKGL